MRKEDTYRCKVCNSETEYAPDIGHFCAEFGCPSTDDVERTEDAFVEAVRELVEDWSDIDDRHLKQRPPRRPRSSIMEMERQRALQQKACAEQIEQLLEEYDE